MSDENLEYNGPDDDQIVHITCSGKTYKMLQSFIKDAGVYRDRISKQRLKRYTKTIKEYQEEGNEMKVAVFQVKLAEEKRVQPIYAEMIKNGLKALGEYGDLEITYED